MMKSVPNRSKKQGSDLPKIEAKPLSISEQQLLFEMAKLIPSEQVIVEIASKTSESTEALSKGAKPDVKIFNLALYGNDRTENKVHGYENIPQVSVLNESVHVSIRHWKETIGLLAVINYQEYREVREAIVYWQRYLSPRVIIAVHNCHEPGPARAIKEFITDGGNFVIWKKVDDITAMVPDRCQHYWSIDSNEIGVCRNCGRKRNFRRLTRESLNLGTERRTTHK